MIYLAIDDDKLLEKYKTIWTKIEGLLNIKLNALPVYDDRFIKIQTRTYGDKFCTKFHDLNMPQEGAECESSTIISIDSLFVCESNYYLKVYLDNCAYKL